MNAIYASGLNGEFALEDGALPWKKNSSLQKECKEDMDFFKHMTAKKAVIMGFNTFKTLPFPLKNRLNIVIKRNAAPQKIERIDNEFFFFSSIEKALNALDFLCPDDIFLIGGKKLFTEAFNKNLVDGIVYETGSRMDEVIFEEFKGTGNSEINLDRKLAERRLFPAINIKKSGTRKEELLLTEDELQKIWVLRKVIAPMEDIEITELILQQMKKSKDNKAFLAAMNTGSAAIN